LVDSADIDLIDWPSLGRAPPPEHDRDVMRSFVISAPGTG
jgi:hypothetical protein